MNNSLVHDFARIRSAWIKGTANGERTGQPVFDRLLSALDAQQPFRPRTPLDMAVLVRHALRFEATRRGPEEVIPHLDMVARVNAPAAEQWQTVGVQLLPRGDGHVLTPLPWEPDWLLPGDEPADLRAVLEDFLRQNEGEAHSADPCLRVLGDEDIQYRSPGQRVAVRSALSAPPGSTLLITLPTGEGKSLVFHSLGLLENGQGVPGVIPVIVPTVALALDHEKSAQKLLKTDRPFAYVGNSPHRSSIFKAIEEGRQGLCFMAPESACGPLKAPLLQAVEKGYLTSFVIDEAHLVEAWGADFRTDFLMLSALWKNMLDKAAPYRQINTVLLSATLPQIAVDTLRTLFSEGNWQVVNGTRLRPELHFFAASPVENKRRESRVLEAVAHLPRPLILYASRPEDVNVWYDLLRQNGYGNVAQFHGGTSTEARNRILDAWSDGRLDMVVGNSAFGLGIDYAHVRSVVHACMPETMDRFYQEVGRGGRDGHSSVSVLIPAHGDMAIAETLNRQKIITLERGHQRWLSMFQHPDRKTLEGRNRYAVRLNVIPSTDQDDLGKVGPRSVEWNERILTVMARAGMLQLFGRYEEEETGHPWAEVEIFTHDHENESAWEAISCLRLQIHDNNAKTLEGVKQYASGKACPAQILAKFYHTDFFSEYERIVPVCSGCPVCGSKGNGLVGDALMPAWPWPVSGTITAELATEFDHNSLLVVDYPEAILSSRRFRREFCETLKGLREFGFSNLLLLGSDHKRMEKDALDLDARKPFFISFGTSWLARSLLPPGPDIVFLLPGFVQDAPLQPGHSPGERLVFIPDSLRDPSRPGKPFLETYSGASTRFETFRNKVRI